MTEKFQHLKKSASNRKENEAGLHQVTLEESLIRETYKTIHESTQDIVIKYNQVYLELCEDSMVNNQDDAPPLIKFNHNAEKILRETKKT